MRGPITSTRMPDIFHNLFIHAPIEEVYHSISDPEELDQWWTKRSSGKPEHGAVYTLFFGPKHDWRAVVTLAEPGKAFEIQINHADSHPAWVGTRIGFVLYQESRSLTEVEFYHIGWPAVTENFRVSSYCWAMYLRILKRWLEVGELIPYEERLKV